MNVTSAQTSLGSHAQYLPQETFAHTAPMNIPAPRKNTAGYSSSRLNSISRSASRGTHMPNKPLSQMNANKAYDTIMNDTWELSHGDTSHERSDLRIHLSQV